MTRNHRFGTLQGLREPKVILPQRKHMCHGCVQLKWLEDVELCFQDYDVSWTPGFVYVRSSVTARQCSPMDETVAIARVQLWSKYRRLAI